MTFGNGPTKHMTARQIAEYNKKQATSGDQGPYVPKGYFAEDPEERERLRLERMGLTRSPG